MKPLPLSVLLIALLGGGTGIVESVVIPEKQTIAIAQSASTGVTWSDLSDLFRRKRRRGGGRGPLTALAPTDISLHDSSAKIAEPIQIWNSKPVFLWRGNADILEVRQSNRDGELIWEKQLKQNEQWVMYGGKKSLKSGKTYVWQMKNSTNQILSSFSFEVMKRKPNKQIKLELKAIARQLKAQSPEKMSDETLAFHRTQYFLQQNMLADAVVEIFQVKEPSDNLKQLRHDFTLTVRPTPKAPTF